MRTIRIKHGSVAATFSLSELESFGYCGSGNPSRETISALAECAFSEICEHPRRFSAQVFLTETSLLLFAEERPALSAIPN